MNCMNPFCGLLFPCGCNSGHTYEQQRAVFDQRYREHFQQRSEFIRRAQEEGMSRADIGRILHSLAASNAYQPPKPKPPIWREPWLVPRVMQG